MGALLETSSQTSALYCGNCIGAAFRTVLASGIAPCLTRHRRPTFWRALLPDVVNATLLLPLWIVGIPAMVVARGAVVMAPATE